MTDTVLLADDDDALRDTFAVWLRPGFEVRTAADGGEVLDAVGPDVDALVLDRRMPGTSGDEALSELRARDDQTPVVVLSAEAADYGVAERGFERYVTKPVTEAELRAAIEDVMAIAEHTEGSVREYVRAANARSALDESKPAAELVEHDVYDRLLEAETTLEARARDAHPDCEECPVRSLLT